MGIEMSKGHVEHPAREPIKIRSSFILKQASTSYVRSTSRTSPMRVSALPFFPALCQLNWTYRAVSVPK